MSDSKQTKIGETYICIKDVVMNGTNVVEFIKGKKYYCEHKGALTNEAGYTAHYFTKELEVYFKQFFTIKDLADGKCAIDNTGNPDVEKLNQVLQLAFPNYKEASGDFEFYSKNLESFSNGKWKAREETYLPTQLLADFELPEEKLEMVEGEYYHVDDICMGEPFWMILKCEGHVHIEDERGDCNGKLISHSGRDGYSYQKNGCCFWDNNGRVFHKATQDEINWLDACIAADKFISHEQYLQDLQNKAEDFNSMDSVLQDMELEEENADNDKNPNLPKIDIIQEWMLVWDNPGETKKKRFVLAKFENASYCYEVLEDGYESEYFEGKEYQMEVFRFAEELPNHDGTEREIDGQTYLLTLKK